jgi:hypothetical protein
MARGHDVEIRTEPGPRGRAPKRRPASRAVHRRRQVTLVASAILLTVAALDVANGGRASAPDRRGNVIGTRAVAARSTPARAGRRSPQPRAAAARHLAVTLPSASAVGWTVVAHVDGQPAAWLEHDAAVTLMRFDQRYVHLTLHAGSSDGGVTGWTYGDQITPREIHVLVAGFNGGFRLSYGDVGFVSGGHVAVPLQPGLASIVTYVDGRTNIGAWRYGVPSSGAAVYSVLQNQHLLVDRGAVAATVTNCILACWGATIQDLTTVARSGMGITAGGQLVWAAGEQLSPAGLADALVRAGAIRAIELDINPDWVAGYLYTHHPTGPVAVPVVPGQLGIAGQLLAPDSRDFLAVIAN